MNKEIFVQNVKTYCTLRGTKPTVACRESGAGQNLISQLITRGSVPSVEKVQLLAQYLGVTTSQLLGEEDPSLKGGVPQPYLVMRYNALSEKDQQDVMDFIEFKTAQAKEK